MGEVAEMMLDGTLCAGCGVFIDTDPPGHPRRCRACRRDPAPNGVGIPKARPRQRRRSKR